MVSGMRSLQRRVEVVRWREEVLNDPLFLFLSLLMNHLLTSEIISRAQQSTIFSLSFDHAMTPF